MILMFFTYSTFDSLTRGSKKSKNILEIVPYNYDVLYVLTLSYIYEEHDQTDIGYAQ